VCAGGQAALIAPATRDEGRVGVGVLSERCGSVRVVCELCLVRTGNLWFALKVLREWIEILRHIFVYFPNGTVFHISDVGQISLIKMPYDANDDMSDVSDERMRTMAEFSGKNQLQVLNTSLNGMSDDLSVRKAGA
jgi:hypothetical protein